VKLYCYEPFHIESSVITAVIQHRTGSRLRYSWFTSVISTSTRPTHTRSILHCICRAMWWLISEWSIYLIHLKHRSQSLTIKF